MKLVYTLLSFLCLCLTVSLSAQMEIITDDDLQGGEYNWTKNKTYLLDGLVYLETGGRLNIEAGTVILGKEIPSGDDNTSALIITRGAQIFAEGTADEPIIFTTEYDDLSSDDDLLLPEDRGYWGGLIVLGHAPIARPSGEDAVEGIESSEERILYGGNNSEDNSGVLRYISIRHGGAALSTGNEINGLTLGGVGSGTTVDYIEVIYNEDDGVELFGGTVNCNHLAVAFCGDDGMDYDFGWRGKGQFWLVLQGAQTPGNAGEHDGAKPDGENPFSRPVIANATYIGGGVDALADNEYALQFRDRAGGEYHNSIFTSFRAKALDIEDLAPGAGSDSHQNLQNGDLILRNNLWWDFGAGDGWNDLLQTYSDGDDPTGEVVLEHLASNRNNLVNPELGGISRTADGGFDPRLDGSSPAMNNALPMEDDYFQEVNYQGAFSNTDNWLVGWTALDSYRFVGDLATVPTEEVTAQLGYQLLPLTPNPTNYQTLLQWEMPETATISIRLVNLLGQSFANLLPPTRYVGGQHQLQIETSNLPVGTYFIQLYTDQKPIQLTRKLVIIR